MEYLDRVDAVARGLASQFKVPLEAVPERVTGDSGNFSNTAARGRSNAVVGRKEGKRLE